MVEITGVEKGSPAEKAGIKKGDYLISVGDKKLRMFWTIAFICAKKV